MKQKPKTNQPKPSTNKCTESKFQDTNQYIFPTLEHKILETWNSTKLFERQEEHFSKEPSFSFYDGPPFATGTPHYGHLLAGTIKDTITRYSIQMGHSCRRVFGWDTHGLPIEFEIEKQLNIKSPDQIQSLEKGLTTYCDHCRSIVMNCESDWKKNCE